MRSSKLPIFDPIFPSSFLFTLLLLALTSFRLFVRSISPATFRNQKETMILSKHYSNMKFREIQQPHIR